MAYTVDFTNVSTVGLESSPFAQALAGVRANEARYFMNKYKHAFTVVPAAESPQILAYVNRVLKAGTQHRVRRPPPGDFAFPGGKYPLDLRLL